jgi:hypothetical protein
MGSHYSSYLLFLGSILLSADKIIVSLDISRPSLQFAASLLRFEQLHIVDKKKTVLCYITPHTLVDSSFMEEPAAPIFKVEL